jgi:uncharacterized protein DUF4166/saccharopine dehydrogenase-like protein
MRAGGLKVLILGGYGTFGGRLAHLLADVESLTLLIAGRSAAKAAEFCTGFRGRARTIPLSFDRNGDVEAQLRHSDPHLIVDASGPFQSYGEDRHRLVKAALAAGVDYIDLADGSEFVKGIRRFDRQAKARGIFVLSGVSTLPVLTAAVVKELAKDMTNIEAVTGGIAPSPYTAVGLSVMRAIAGYAGKPVTLVRDGASAVGYALTQTRRYTIAPPCRLPLPNILFSLVDVPDLQVLPELWPGVRSVWIGAGPIPEFLHRVLIGLAWMVRLRVLPTLAPFAGLMYRTVNWLARGEHRAGMFVSVEGTSPAGERSERSWHLVAEGEDGPFIPSMAAEAIVRRCLHGRRPDAGARAAAGELDLDAYRELFARRAIYSGFRERTPATARWPLYRRLLGQAWNDLPIQLREVHGVEGRLIARGLARVERGTRLLARFAATAFGFPPEGREIPIQVDFTVENGRETWVRSFAGNRFATVQTEGEGRSEGLLCERFGPVVFAIALVVEDGRLQFVVRGWSFLGVPLPVSLAPLGNAYEHVSDGRFGFDVEIRHRWLGRIVHYCGWLVPDRTGIEADASRAAQLV